MISFNLVGVTAIKLLSSPLFLAIFTIPSSKKWFSLYKVQIFPFEESGGSFTSTEMV
jgi:hypothetical protein